MTLRVLSVAYSLAAAGAHATGGAEQVLAQIDRALTRGGAESLVVACAGSRVTGTLIATPEPRGPLDHAAREAAVDAHRRAIVHAVERWRPDVVHLHGIDFYEYLPILDAARVPVLVTLHLAPSGYTPAALWAGTLRHDAGRTFFHCVSESQRRAFESHAPGLSLLPTIGNGVCLSTFRPTSHRGDYVATLGRICPEKGYHEALDAAHCADVPMLLAGQVFSYPEHERYFADAIRPRLDGRRRFIGRVYGRRKRRLLAGARALLVPSRCAETSSLVAMEALACGTPVIAYASGALPEIIDHGETGFLVRDVSEMADAIDAARAIDPRACRAAAHSRFSERRTTQAYLRLCEAIAGEARSTHSTGPRELHA